LQLWSAEGDVVLSPFMGVGSEGVCSIEMGRKFVGVELKKSYFDLAVKNLAKAQVKANASQCMLALD
jgi:DNA modification methylase